MHKCIGQYRYFYVVNDAYLLLGSNEGDRLGWMNRAIALISDNCGKITDKSSVYETAAWGITDQPAFLNMVVALSTDMSPQELLTAILAIETSLGRHRQVKWGQRTIDIDILLYNSQIIETAELIIPHPYMHERRFTLVPLAELAPGFVHPKLNKTISSLLAQCPDMLAVSRYENT